MEQKSNLCPHCKMQVDPTASRCPYCHGKIFRWTKGRKILIGIFAFVVFLFIITSSGSNHKNTVAPVVKTGPSDVEVCVEAEHILEQFLKAPSTAKYPTCNDTSITKLDGDQFRVSAYVDSQNGFGAMIRSDYTVAYHYTDNGTKIQVDLVTLEGETVFDRNSK